MRIAFVAVVSALLLVVAPASASAHGDRRLADETVTIEPGARARFVGSLHYHRLVGRIAADRPVLARLIDPEGRVAVERGPAGSITLNDLVTCCEHTWTPYALEIENPGDDPLTVHVVAGLLHDDLAVTVYRAESGIPLTIAMFAAIWVGVLARARRRDVRARLRSAVLTFAGIVVVVGGLGVFGAARYGGDGPPAMIAALLDVPLMPFNPGLARATVLLLAVMIGWMWAGARWARANPRGAPMLWRAHGLAVIASVVATMMLMIRAYDAALIPVAWAVAAGAPVAVVLMQGPVRTRNAVERPAISAR